MEEMDATAQLDSTRRKDGNIKSIRLIRTKEAAAEKEFLKEFFRGIGCSVNDAICVSKKEMQGEQEQCHCVYRRPRNGKNFGDDIISMGIERFQPGEK